MAGFERRAGARLSAHRGAARPVHLGGPAEPLEHPDRVGGDIELTGVHAVAGRARERVVRVVPGVAETEERQWSEVGAAILVPEGLLAEGVAQRVGAPRDVVQKCDPDHPGPESGQERALDTEEPDKLKAFSLINGSGTEVVQVRFIPSGVQTQSVTKGLSRWASENHHQLKNHMWTGGSVSRPIK